MKLFLIDNNSTLTSLTWYVSLPLIWRQSLNYFCIVNYQRIQQSYSEVSVEKSSDDRSRLLGIFSEIFIMTCFPYLWSDVYPWVLLSLICQFNRVTPKFVKKNQAMTVSAFFISQFIRRSNLILYSIAPTPCLIRCKI